MLKQMDLVFICIPYKKTITGNCSDLTSSFKNTQIVKNLSLENNNCYSKQENLKVRVRELTFCNSNLTETFSINCEVFQSLKFALTYRLSVLGGAHSCD